MTGPATSRAAVPRADHEAMRVERAEAVARAKLEHVSRRTAPLAATRLRDTTPARASAGERRPRPTTTAGPPRRNGCGKGADDRRHLVRAAATTGSPTTSTSPSCSRTSAALRAGGPVDEVEPVAPRRARDAVDRDDEAAAVRRLHVRLPLERLHRRQPGRARVAVRSTCSPRSRVTQSVALPPSPPQPARARTSGEQRQRGVSRQRVRANRAGERRAHEAACACRRSRPRPASRPASAPSGVRRRAARRRPRPCARRCRPPRRRGSSPSARDHARARASSARRRSPNCAQYQSTVSPSFSVTASAPTGGDLPFTLKTQPVCPAPG